MDLSPLRVIVASARNGSFSADAHDINVCGPIVSRSIKQVEQVLKVQWFDQEEETRFSVNLAEFAHRGDASSKQNHSMKLNRVPAVASSPTGC